jgi:hypothetical protein
MQLAYMSIKGTIVRATKPLQRHMKSLPFLLDQTDITEGDIFEGVH